MTEKKLEKMFGKSKTHSAVSLDLLEVEEAVRKLLKTEEETDHEQGSNLILKF